MTDEKSKTSDPVAIAAAAAKPIKIKMGKTQTGAKGRVSAKLAALLEHMAYKGASLPEAAQRAGMDLRSARHAFRKGHVRNAYNQLVKDIRDNAAQSAYLRINHLSEAAASEHVRLDANKWVAGVDGIAPVQRFDGNIRHTVQFGNYEYGPDKAVDITPSRGESDE